MLYVWTSCCLLNHPEKSAATKLENYSFNERVTSTILAFDEFLRDVVLLL